MFMAYYPSLDSKAMDFKLYWKLGLWGNCGLCATGWSLPSASILSCWCVCMCAHEGPEQHCVDCIWSETLDGPVHIP